MNRLKDNHKSSWLGNTAWIVSFIIGFAITGFFMLESRQLRNHATPDRARRKH